MFIPIWGKIPILTHILSKGLVQPPSRIDFDQPSAVETVFLGGTSLAERRQVDSGQISPATLCWLSTARICCTCQPPMVNIALEMVLRWEMLGAFFVFFCLCFWGGGT